MTNSDLLRLPLKSELKNNTPERFENCTPSRQVIIGKNIWFPINTYIFNWTTTKTRIDNNKNRYNIAVSAMFILQLLKKLQGISKNYLTN